MREEGIKGSRVYVTKSLSQVYVIVYYYIYLFMVANWAAQLSCVDLCNNIIAFLAIILFLGSDAVLLTFSARFSLSIYKKFINEISDGR